MSQRDYIPDEEAEGEEEEELVQLLESEHSNEPLEDAVPDTNSAENESANVSGIESEQSFVGKIRHNVSSVLSRMIRTAKDRFVASSRLRECEYDRSEMQPAKRRRLQEADKSDEGFPQGSQSSNVPLSLPGIGPLSGSRVDRSCQTNQSDMAHAPSKYSRTNRNTLPGSGSVTSVFARSPLTFQCYGESSVFKPPVSHRKQLADRGGKRQREENEEDVEENVKEKEEEEEQLVNTKPIEPFDPFKFLAQYDNTSVDPKRRLSGFLGNRCYQRRQQQLRRGVVGQYFFSSHHKPTKNLDTASSSETDSSSRRPFFSRASYRGAASGQRIPPEHGGSLFYNGFTCYGGASAANTLGTHYTAARSTVKQDNTVLVRKSPLLSLSSISSSSSSAISRNVNVTPAQEAVTPVLSTTTQRMMNIWQEFDTSKQSTKKVQETLTDVNSRTRPYAGISCIPEMLQILREQKLASVGNARTGPEKHPPTIPLINVRPLYANQPIARRDEFASPDRNLTPEATNTSIDVAEPALEEEEKEEDEKIRDVLPTEKSTVQPTTVVQQQQQQKTKLPSEPREEHVPKCDVTKPSQSPPPVEEELVDAEVSVLTDEDTDEQERDTPLQKTDTSSTITTTVQVEEVQLFTFAEPISMNDFSDQCTERDSVPAQLSIQFDAPELLQQEEHRTIRSFQELMAESASKWICDVCMVRNEPHQLTCVACESTKPSNQKKQQVPQQPPLPISTPPSSSSFASIMSAQSSRWECDACCVRNEPTAVVCVCCGTAKSSGGAEGAVETREKEPEQPKKANDMTTLTTAKNPATDSPFSNMPNLKDTFKSLLERQDTSAMWQSVYDLCQTSDANEQSSSSCEQSYVRSSVPNKTSQSGTISTSTEPSQPNDRVGADSAFNGVHSFRVDPAVKPSNPFHSAATISQPLFATATIRSESTEPAAAPSKPYMFTGFTAPAKALGEPPLKGSEHLGGNIFNKQTNANNNNVGISVISWEKSAPTNADNNSFEGLFAQSAPPGGLRTDNSFTSSAAIADESNEASGQEDETPRNASPTVVTNVGLKRAVGSLALDKWNSSDEWYMPDDETDSEDHTDEDDCSYVYTGNSSDDEIERRLVQKMQRARLLAHRKKTKMTWCRDI